MIKVPALAGGAGKNERVNHPTQKPLALCKKLIQASMKKEEENLVVVPFAGSGSECVAAQELGCNFVVTMGGVPIADNRDSVYVAATSSTLASEFKEQGATIYEKGKIVGGTGLTLALAKELDVEGVCLLGSTTGFKADRGTGYQVFKLLMKFLGKEIKEGL